MSDVSTDDVRALLRLSRETRELPNGSRDQRQHALEGLSRIVGAQVGIWVDFDPGPPPRIVPVVDFGWSDEGSRAVFRRYILEQQVFADPSLQPLSTRMKDGVTTFERSDLVSDREWYRSAHVMELRRDAGVDSFIYSGWLANGQLQAFAMHRPWGDKPFGDRERTLVDAFHTESPWLHPPPSPIDTLPTRLKQVLGLLTKGLSEKQIAAELTLSAHTIHDYVKALHRRLGVNSRGELLALALRANPR